MSESRAGERHLGAIVVIEHGPGLGIVMVTPPGGPLEAPASLPGGLAEAGETQQEAALRLARDLTGLDVALGPEIIRFVQEGTPNGTVEVAGFVAHPIGGSLRSEGEEGSAAVYSLDALPAIIPIRAANQTVLTAYLRNRAVTGPGSVLSDDAGAVR